MTSICPYCKKALSKNPTRKVNCPMCGKTMYVRGGKTVTTREKEILDWQRYMEFLVPDIEAVRKEVENKLKNRFGKEPSSGDLVWGMFNFIVTKLRKPYDLEILYENMATFLESENKKENAFKLHQQATKMKVRGLMAMDWLIGVRIKNQEDGFVCKACTMKNSNQLSLKEAYKNPPTPVEGCQNKKCRCMLEGVDKNFDKEYLNKEYPVTIEVRTPKKKGWLSKLLS